MHYSITSGEAPNEYLFSQVGHATRSVTIASGAVNANDNGNHILNKGAVLAKITSGVNIDKYGPFETTATDGRQTTANIVGINDTYANVDDGDVLAGSTYKGTVRSDVVTVDVAGVHTAIKDYGSFAAVRDALANPAYEMDILCVDASV